MYQKLIQFIKDVIFHRAALSPDIADWDLYVDGHKVGTINYDEIELLKTTTLKSFSAWLNLVKFILVWILKIFFYALFTMPVVCLIIIWAAANSPEMWPQFVAELMENSTTVLRLFNAAFYYSFIVSLCVWVLLPVIRSRPFTFSRPNPFMDKLEDKIRAYKGITILGVMHIPPKVIATKSKCLGKAVGIKEGRN